MRLFRWLWQKLSVLWRPHPDSPFRTVDVEELPDELSPRTVYVAGENGHYWFVGFLCPCGCGESVELSLLTDARPRWSLTRHGDGTVTLKPSVWRKVGCKSHFFFTAGQIEWCH